MQVSYLSKNTGKIWQIIAKRILHAIRKLYYYKLYNDVTSNY